MVLTVFILLYVSQLKTKQKTTTTTKQTSNTLRMYMLVYYQFNTCSALYHHLLSLAHLPKLPAEHAVDGGGGGWGWRVQDRGGGGRSGAVC